VTAKLVILGLDCAPPSLVFDRYRDVMPCCRALAARGLWGPLRSTLPPITVPAWTSMVSGRDPGELGLYGFRNRVAGSYDLRVATSRDVEVKRVWDRIGDGGRRVSALFVPLTSPPSPVRGTMASCFLTPPGAPWTFPASLAESLEREHGPYRADVHDFRSEDRARILDDIYAMGGQHFAIAKTVWDTAAPDFLMMVEMGPDRFHHAFWADIDPTHWRHDPAGPFVDAGTRYYAFLDAQIGELLGTLGNDTTVMIVSDHGARAMDGGVRLNEWLRRHGWLVTEGAPAAGTGVDPARIDWSRTRAWAAGGYYGRIFLNVAGREPEGIVDPTDYERVRTELADALRSDLARVDGVEVGAEAVRPEEAYRQVRGLAPDLLVFLGDLRFRAIGTFGSPDAPLFTRDNDTGPDGCNHDWEGIFLLAGPNTPAAGRLEGLELYDVHATALALMGIELPSGLRGRDVRRIAPANR
jgi:predicted AlkP superfamily phosphohydrolase/phosphomutase